MQEMSIRKRLTGTPQGGVLSPLLSNLFLHVVFDKWMDINHQRSLLNVMRTTSSSIAEQKSKPSSFLGKSKDE
jgi:retron-type reverse transcriptase